MADVQRPAPILLPQDERTALPPAGTPEPALPLDDRLPAARALAQPALIDGEAGLVWAPGGQPKVVFALHIDGDVITRIDAIADPGHLARLELVILD